MKKALLFLTFGLWCVPGWTQTPAPNSCANVNDNTCTAKPVPAPYSAQGVTGQNSLTVSDTTPSHMGSVNVEGNATGVNTSNVAGVHNFYNNGKAGAAIIGYNETNSGEVASLMCSGTAPSSSGGPLLMQQDANGSLVGGGGSLMLVKVTWAGSAYSCSMAAPGTGGYTALDTYIIHGSDPPLGGTSPANDITVTIVSTVPAQTDMGVSFQTSGGASLNLNPLVLNAIGNIGIGNANCPLANVTFPGGGTLFDGPTGIADWYYCEALQGAGLISTPRRKLFLNQTANIGTTTIYTTPAANSLFGLFSGAGQYRITAYLDIISNTGTGATLPLSFALWTDMDTGTTNTAALTGTSTANSVGTNSASCQATCSITGLVTGSQTFWAAAGTNIQVGTSSYATGTGTMTYNARFTLERVDICGINGVC